MKRRKNPYAKLLKQPVTIRLDRDTVAYFKELAVKTGLPYQNLHQSLLTGLCGPRIGSTARPVVALTPSNTATMKILVVDDEKIKRITLADDLATQGHEVVTAADGEEALEKLAAGRFDVVVTDLKMPKLDGIELLKRIKQGPLADMEVIMMTAYGSIPVAVEAVKLGAFDFLTKPFRNEDIFPLLARIERQRRGGRRTAPPRPFSAADVDAAIVGRSAAMDRVKRMVEICAKTDANVLLCGETGVGKDLLATIIHRNSHRHGFPYVKVGCTLFPPQLIESELYGHEKGSFTGAEQQRKGRFDLAEGGTLYLDDVDDIPLEQQAKLLAGDRGEGVRAGRRRARRSRPTCGSSPRPSGTCWKRSARARSARTSTIGSTCCGSTSRRCANGWKTCRCWPSIC